MTILDFTEQNHVVLDFSGNVPAFWLLVIGRSRLLLAICVQSQTTAPT
jgi:hypothetical protein